MAANLETLASSVALELQGLKTSSQLDEPSRASLLAKINQLRASLMSPPETLLDLTQSSNRFATARIAIATGIFDAFAAAGDTPVTIQDIMPNVKADQQLTFRLVRLLAAKGFLIEVGPGQYKSAPLGLMMANNSPPAMFVIHFYDSLKVHGELFDYFVKNGFTNPGDYYRSPWAQSYNNPKGFFDWVSRQELRQQAFNVVMTVNQQFRGQDWFEFFPVAERFQGLTSPEDVILVDIGGGIGHDAIGFREAYADCPGKVVLQDLPTVASEVKTPLPKNFEVQAYNFFYPQPIKGAKVYYLRTVLHDWPDKQALEILKNVKAAMTEESILLVNENLMLEENPSEISIDVDFIMMMNMGSLERTESQWKKLLQAAGYKIVNIWRPTTQQVSPHALFEAVPL